MAQNIPFQSSNCHVIFGSGVLAGFLLFLGFYYSFLSNSFNRQAAESLSQDSYNDPSIYDDPSLSYTIQGPPIKNWDEKRRQWKLGHPSFLRNKNTIFMLTGSQPGPCQNPVGDHLLLRFYKNKADYCRLHGIDLLYNNALLHPNMSSFWAKIPVIRSAMIAHPEAEWIWWVDSDAVFTDMELELPIDKYQDYNLILEGDPKEVFENKSWVGLNAGVILMRNCQWSLDFIDRWAQMGPQSPEFEKWGKIQRSLLKDKLFPDSDDQSAIIYLLIEENGKWGDKIYLENQYPFQGYWLPIVEKLENLSSSTYLGVRRRQAEKTILAYRRMRPEKKSIPMPMPMPMPLITHFTGCQPCSGGHNEMYSWKSCWEGMEMALNFADDQVLTAYGFRHDRLVNSSGVKPLANFDFPA